MSKLLKEYISEILQEKHYWYGKSAEENEDQEGFFSKIKSLFFGDNVDKFVGEWMEDQSTYYDVELDDNFEKEVKDFVKKKFKKALSRAKGDKEKAMKLMRRALDIRYSRKLRDLEKQNSIDLSKDDDEA
jgi:predicted metal-dependent hydrolase